MAAIEFRSVSKRFGDTLAVDDVSFRIEDGEFFCFFGPPLAGKSTILRMILGLDRPDSGEILFRSPGQFLGYYKDEAITEIAQQQPKSAEELSRLRALPRGYERSKAGEQIVAAVMAGLARDPKGLPKIVRDKPLSNGASATVELLKVLLRMTSERHGVAAKVIATVDELERIAVDENADVPALKGWRREMFGNEALKLRRGGVALAIEGGRVVAVERAAPPDHFRASGNPV